MLNFKTYEESAHKTATYRTDHVFDNQEVLYPAIGMVTESAEFLEKIKKQMRGDPNVSIESMVLELGDVLWYLTILANRLGSSLEEVAIS